MEGMHEGQVVYARHNPAMRVASPPPEQRDIAGSRSLDLTTTRHNSVKIVFLRSMYEPFVVIWTRIEWLANAGIHEDADNQHKAVNACTTDIRLMMVWRADPFPGFRDDFRSLIHG
jgi:hypothetical protein